MMLLPVWIGCSPDPFRPADDERVLKLAFDPDAALANPSDPVVDNPEVAAVGKLLFADTSLSADGSVSCATCHDLCLDQGCAGPFAGGSSAADPGVAFSEGVGGLLARNTPTLRESAWRPRFGLVGQYCEMDEQNVAPIEKELVYGHPAGTAASAVAAVVRATYTWPAVWSPISNNDDVVLTQIGLALEGFIRTLPPTVTLLDQVLAGDAEFDPSELRGLALFVEKAHCIDCHVGPLQTDDQRHGTAVPGDDPGAATAPLCLNDGEAPAAGAFLTPPLRNITLTPPYMHDGSLATLEDVVWHYNEGGVLPPEVVGVPDPRFQPLSLDPGERADLVAFLATLGPT